MSRNVCSVKKLAVWSILGVGTPDSGFRSARVWAFRGVTTIWPENAVVLQNFHLRVAELAARK